MSKFKQNLRRIDWANHLLNFIGTCLGVLLALYLTNYQENQRDHQRLQIAMKNIISEIKQNNNKTRKHLATVNKQLEAINVIQSIVNEQDSVVGTEAQVMEVVKKYPAIFAAEKRNAAGNGKNYWKASMNLSFDLLDVSDIAWRNAQSMDILHLVDFKQADDLYSLYNFQYQVLADVNKAVEILKNAPNSDKSGLQLILQDYKNQLNLARDFEKGLSESYEALLKSLTKSKF